MALLTSNLRRRLLQVVGASFLAYTAGGEPTWAQSVPTGLERKTFAAFLNVLLPRDALTGSATDLQVDAKLWAFAKLDPNFHRLVTLGSQWLNMTGGVGFADLSGVQQTNVVQWMSNSDWNEIPRRFYELVRQVAIETYYSEPSSWAGLPLQSPPQPLGYPPPWA